jgi:hypothetical protein
MLPVLCHCPTCEELDPTDCLSKTAATLCAAFALAGSVVARSELQEDIERAISAAEVKLHKRHHLDLQGQQQDVEFRDTSEELRAAGASQYEAARLLHKLQIAYRMRGSDESDDGILCKLPVEIWDQQERALIAFNEATARAIQLLNEFVIKYPGAWSPTAVYIPPYFTRGAG